MIQPAEVKVGDTIQVKYDDGTPCSVFTVTKRINFKNRGCYRLYLQHEHGWGCAVAISRKFEEWPKQWDTVTKVDEGPYPRNVS